MIVLAASTLLLLYLSSYLYVRKSRLTFEHLYGGVDVAPVVYLEEVYEELIATRDSWPLSYYDSGLLYVLYWPCIHIDSAISGRDIESPFEEDPYVIPMGSGSPVIKAHEGMSLEEVLGESQDE